MKRGSLVAGLVSVAFGLTLGVWLEPSLLSDVRIAAYSREWPETNGTVLESRTLRLSSRFSSAYLAVVTYVYEVSDRKHIRSQVLCECPSELAADELLLRFPKGRQTAVFYHASDPSLSVVQRRGFDGRFLAQWGLEIGSILMFVVVLPLSLWILSSNSAAHADARGASRLDQPSQPRAGGRER